MHEPVLRTASGAAVISLIGMPASGKTSIGRRLARRLDIPFIDLDEAVEQRAGRSVPEIFDKVGESGFRLLETAALTQAVSNDAVVLATGGGAVLSQTNREMLRHATIPVYLVAEIAQLWQRLERGSKRPLLATGDPYATLCSLFEQRRPLYADLAAITVDTVDRSTTAIVQFIVERLMQRGWAAVA